MTNQTNALSNVLGSIITQAAQLPDTGVAAKYQARIGTGNPNSRVMLIDTSGWDSYRIRVKTCKIDL